MCCDSLLTTNSSDGSLIEKPYIDTSCKGDQSLGPTCHKIMLGVFSDNLRGRKGEDRVFLTRDRVKDDFSLEFDEEPYYDEELPSEGEHIMP